MRKYIFILGIIILSLCACSKEGLTQYDAAKNYLYIPNDKYMDTTFVTFKHHPGIDDYDVFFEVRLIGIQLIEDKSYSIEVVKDKTTAKVEDYTLDTEQIFHAGVLKDQLKITLHNTAHLLNETVRVTLRLTPNENFGVADYLGESESRAQSLTASVAFDNQISKPSWWNSDIEMNYLGEWTPIKYEKFIESCGGEVLDLSEYEGYQIMELAVKFKNDIDKYGWKDKDNELIDLPIY